ncbi:hypothetical protein HZC09_04255, partial [Candidatus Micrarchaeota archaeon]|nr:hypothetical protein [Candidatus Micrarchaeota archaeon]
DYSLKQRLNALAKDFGKTREQLTKEHGNKILGHLQIFGYQQEKDDYSLKQRLNALAKDFGKTREQLTKEHGNKILGHLPIFGLQQEKDDYSLKKRTVAWHARHVFVDGEPRQLPAEEWNRVFLHNLSLLGMASEAKMTLYGGEGKKPKTMKVPMEKIGEKLLGEQERGGKWDLEYYPTAFAKLLVASQAKLEPHFKTLLDTNATEEEKEKAAKTIGFGLIPGQDAQIGDFEEILARSGAGREGKPRTRRKAAAAKT